MYIPYRRTLMPASRIRLVRAAPGSIKMRRGCSSYVTEVVILKMKPQWAVMRILLRKHDFFGKVEKEVKHINDPMIESYKHFCYIDQMSPLCYELIREETERAQKVCNELNQQKEPS